jgi:uncharacterized repeat protein (TIGR01451 family)
VANTASVATTNDGTDEDTDVVDVLGPDLAVAKTADASPISAGDTASFTITVTNVGQGTAFDVVLTDTLPGGLTWTTTAAGCTIAGDQLTCAMGTLPTGATRTVTVTAETTAQSCGPLENTASATSSTELANLANNEATATVTVDCADVVITKSAVDPVVTAGGEIAFDIVVTNNGDGNAYGVTVTDTLPDVAGTAWSIDAANSDAGWTLTVGSLAWGPGTVAAGSSVKVRVVSDTTSASCGPVPNQASVTYQGGSDVDQSSIVVECPDLTIAKTAHSSPILAGDTASFTISVWNEGEGTAVDVVIEDQLPGGLAWTADSDACAISATGLLTCEVGDLAPDAMVSVTVSAPTTVEACGELPNTASVAAANEPAEALGNNEDDASISVECASIRLVKTAGDAADGAELLLEDPGDVVFSYLVTNTGTADLVDLVLVDDNATPGDPADDIDVTCPATTLAAGAAMTCTATLPVAVGLRTNIAVVTASPDIAPEAEVTDSDDAVVRVPEPEVTPTPRPTRTPRITPPPTSTVDATATPISAGTGLLLVLLSLAGIMLALGYLVPSPARARRRNRRG